MNKLTIIGNVCHAPELRTTQAGHDVCSFDVAVNSRRGDKSVTYIRCSAWNKLAGVCQQYLAKGKKVCVIGEVSARAFLGKDGQPRASLELSAEDVEFLSPKEQGGQFVDQQIAQVEAEQRQAAEQYQREGWQEINDSDLPF